jgi:hypothetical protein
LEKQGNCRTREKSNKPLRFASFTGKLPVGGKLLPAESRVKQTYHAGKRQQDESSRFGNGEEEFFGRQGRVANADLVEVSLKAIHVIVAPTSANEVATTGRIDSFKSPSILL